MAVSQGGPVVQSALLRNELVRLRKSRGLTQGQVARDLDWSSSKLIRIEGGKSGLTRTDLLALLDRYGVSSEEQVARLLELQRGARGPAWWDSYKEFTSEGYLTYIGYEAGASCIGQFESLLIPGLLQTQEYAEIITTSYAGPRRAGPLVELRLRRQQELQKRENPPYQYYILDEAAIRRHVGVSRDPSIMPNQLQHIIDLAESQERFRIRILPFSHGSHVGMPLGSFVLLEFEEDLNEILYIEGRAPSSTITDESQITDYRDAFEALKNEALPQEESLQLIADAAEEMMS